MFDWFGAADCMRVGGSTEPPSTLQSALPSLSPVAHAPPPPLPAPHPPQDAPDVSTQAGKVALLKRFRAQLGEWGPLLQRFLKSEDDQVRPWVPPCVCVYVLCCGGRRKGGEEGESDVEGARERG